MKKSVELIALPFGVVTVIGPEFADGGTTAEMVVAEAEFTIAP